LKEQKKGNFVVIGHESELTLDAKKLRYVKFIVP